MDPCLRALLLRFSQSLCGKLSFSGMEIELYILRWCSEIHWFDMKCTCWKKIKKEDCCLDWSLDCCFILFQLFEYFDDNIFLLPHKVTFFERESPLQQVPLMNDSDLAQQKKGTALLYVSKLNWKFVFLIHIPCNLKNILLQIFVYDLKFTFNRLKCCRKW